MKWAIAALCVLPAIAANSTAVLPFANTSGEPVNANWVGESIAESVREALSAKGVPIAARERIWESFTALRLRPFAELTRASALKLGHEIGAQTIVYGTFAIAKTAEGETLTIRAHMLTPSSFEQSARIEDIGPLHDLIALEGHFAWRIVAMLAPKAAPPEAEFASLRPAVRLDAEERYIRGLLAETPEEMDAHFLEAARLDTQFWRPAFQLGKARFDREQYAEAATWFARVGPGDQHYAEANFFIGLAKYHAGGFEAARDIFADVARRDPSPEAFNNLGAMESRLGSMHALDSFARALEASPNDPDYHFNLGYILWKTGQFDIAADRFRDVLERAPEDPMATLLLGRCLQRQGLRKGADARLATLERIKNRYEDEFETTAP